MGDSGVSTGISVLPLNSEFQRPLTLKVTASSVIVAFQRVSRDKVMLIKKESGIKFQSACEEHITALGCSGNKYASCRATP